MRKAGSVIGVTATVFLVFCSAAAGTANAEGGSQGFNNNSGDALKFELRGEVNREWGHSQETALPAHYDFDVLPA
ncbi:hypothetical protein [Streptomyces sp. NPDC004134]|uniref:hypothetical protein n=1 Tax=Streptomyces sp. NPDC004134 TaxID=3364691 RepID=UPI0036A3E1F9